MDFKESLAPQSGGHPTCIFMCTHAKTHSLIFLEQETKMQSLTVQNIQLQCLPLLHMDHLMIRRITVCHLVLMPI